MNESTNRPLILASASPRRQDLLRQLGYDFVVRPADIDETPLPDEKPTDYVLRVAVDKARTVAQREPEAAILAADTTVYCEGVLFGKPADSRDALRMLGILSGREHEVITGVVLIARRQEYRKLNTSHVTFRTISEEERVAYANTEEPLDKAGAYALQGRGAAFVAQVRGSPSGVMGLPLCETDELLKNLRA